MPASGAPNGPNMRVWPLRGPQTRAHPAQSAWRRRQRAPRAQTLPAGLSTLQGLQNCRPSAWRCRILVTLAARRESIRTGVPPRTAGWPVTPPRVRTASATVIQVEEPAGPKFSAASGCAAPVAFKGARACVVKAVTGFLAQRTRGIRCRSKSSAPGPAGHLGRRADPTWRRQTAVALLGR